MPQEKHPCLAPKLPVPYEKFKSACSGCRSDLTDQVQALEEKITSLRNEAETMRVQVSKLTPWLPLDIPIEELTSTANTEIFAGFIADGTLEKLRKDLENLTCELKVLGKMLKARLFSL
jgi:V/A-type H+-transporting ATPase subunit I